jgi:hypothetical protein
MSKLVPLIVALGLVVAGCALGETLGNAAGDMAGVRAGGLAGVQAGGRSAALESPLVR